MKKVTPLEAKVQELKKRMGTLSRGNDYVPAKKKSKPVGYKLQNTFEKSIQGVPGGKGMGGVINMINAANTGTRVRKEGIGVLHSAHNANTTSGSYIRSVVVEQGGHVVSNAQGRKEFGR